MADSYLGKVKTIMGFSVAYMLGLIVLFLTSLPFSIENGYAFGGLIVAMILIGMFVIYYTNETTILLTFAAVLAVSSRLSPHSSQSNILEQNKPFESLTPVSV